MSENRNEEIPRKDNRWRGFDHRMNPTRNWRGGHGVRLRAQYGRIFPFPIRGRGWFRGRGRTRGFFPHFPDYPPPMLPQNFQNQESYNIEINNPLPNEPFKAISITKPVIDEQLSATIDTVKKRLVERKISETGDTIIEDTPLVSPRSPIVKTSQKRRIEHTKLPGKDFAERKIAKLRSISSKSTKAKTSSSTNELFDIECQHWRKKILKQLFSLNMDKLKCLVNNPDLAKKYDPALQTYLKQARTDISNQLRNAAEQSLFENEASAYSIHGKKIMQDAFMGQLGKMLDTDVSLELENMNSQLIEVLSNVLQEDLLIPNNDDEESIKHLSDVITDPNIENENIIKSEIKDERYENSDCDAEENFNSENIILNNSHTFDNMETYDNESFLSDDNLDHFYYNSLHLNEDYSFETEQKYNINSTSDENLSNTQEKISTLQNSHNTLISTGAQSEKTVKKNYSSQTENLDISNENTECCSTSVHTILMELKKIDYDINTLMQKKFKLYGMLDKINYVNTDFMASMGNNKIENRKSKIFEKRRRKNLSTTDEQSTSNTEDEPTQDIENVKNNDTQATLLNLNTNNKTGTLKTVRVVLDKLQMNPTDSIHLQSSEKKNIFPNTNDTNSEDSGVKCMITENEKKNIEPNEKSNLICLQQTTNEKSQRKDFIGHQASIIALECIGNEILAASLDGHIYVYCFSTKLLRKLKVSEKALSCMILNSTTSSSNIFIGSLDSTLKCYNYKTGKQVSQDLEISSSIRCMHEAWGNIYLGLLSGFLMTYNIKSKKICEEKTLNVSDTPIFDIQAVKEGPRKVLIVGSRSKQVTISDANTGLLLRLLKEPVNVNSINILLYHNNKIYTGTNGSDINIFDFHTGDLLDTYQGGSMTMCMKIYKGLLFTGSLDGQINVFPTDSSTNKTITRVLDLKKPILKFEIDDDKIIVSCSDESLTMWKIPTKILDLMQ